MKYYYNIVKSDANKLVQNNVNESGMLKVKGKKDVNVCNQFVCGISVSK